MVYCHGYENIIVAPKLKTIPIDGKKVYIPNENAWTNICGCIANRSELFLVECFFFIYEINKIINTRIFAGNKYTYRNDIARF